MKRNCKRLTALILAMAMCLSMLSSAAWATDASVELEDVTESFVTTDAEETTDEEEEDTSADAASEAAEETTTDEESAEESVEEPAEEEAAEESTEEPAAEEEAEESTEEPAAEDEAAEKSVEEPAEEEAAEETASEDEAETEVTAQDEESGEDEGGDEEDEDYSVGNGVAYTLEDGVLTIYRTDEEDQDGRMWDWGDGDSPFAWRDDITSIVIEDGVTYIGSNAFHGCSVESLSIGADVEDINFGDGAFVWCTQLSSIEVSEDNGTYAVQDGVLFQKDDEGNLSELKLYPVGDESTSYEIPDGVWCIEQWAFFYADSLEEITIPYSVTDIGYEAFYNCYNLYEVTIPDTVTSISDHAFGWVDTDEGELPLDGFIVYGYANTQAQWYAEGNELIFEEIGGENTDGEGDFGEDGDNLHWVLEDGVLTISVNDGCDNGWMGEMDRGDAPWYDMRHSIYEVVIEDGVGSIANFAFYTCTSLSAVSVPDSVTSVGDWAFAQCSSLGSVELSDNVEWIGPYAFYRSALTEFTIPNNSGLTEICDGTFQGTDLESITIPRRITSIDYEAFRDCCNLTEVTFTGTSKLSYIGSCAFQNCSSLTSIEVPSGVTNIENWAFQGCTALESVTLPDDEDFTRIPSGMFSDCESLTSVTIPDSVTWIGNDAFANCTSLESVNIPDGVDYIYSWTFYNCSSLDGVTLPDGVTCIEDEAFRDCSSLTSINLPESLTQICYAAFEGCSSLSGDLVIPDSVTELSNEAFYGCSSLTSVTLPSNDEYTGISERTFQYCSGLTSVTIPDGVTWIGGSAFEGCTSLEYIELPDSVDTIEWWAFAYCPLTGLEDDTLVISENVYNVGDHAFYACGFNNVIIYSTEIDIGGEAFGWDGDDEEAYGTLDGFTVYGYSDTSAQWYADDNGLTFVGLDWEYEGQCGDNVYWTIEDGVLTLYTEGEAEDEEQNGRMWDYDNWDDSPFTGRSDITSIVISDGVTYIGNGAFQNCYNVESLYLGADVEDINFGGGAFVWCTALSTIEVSADNVTFYAEDDVLFRDDTLCLYPSCKEGDSYAIPDSVNYIEQWAFYHNENLTSVTIPESVYSIGYEAFYNCINLWEVTIPDTVTSIDYHAFGFADQEDEDGNWYEEMDGFTVYGYENTAAQDYADQYDSIIFVALEVESVNVSGYFGTNLYWTLDEEGTLTISVVDGAESGSMDFLDVGNVPWYEYRLNVKNVVIETGVEGIGTCAFYNCVNLESVDIQADITYIDWDAFGYCRSLGEITIPDSVTYIDNWAFESCYGLSSVTLPTNDEFTRIAQGVFSDCSSLESITIPASVTSIAAWAFQGSSLTEIVIPDSVTGIGIYAFYQCANLNSVTLPTNDEFTEIQDGLFCECSSLAEITIPDSVTDIYYEAFSSTALESVEIPDSVNYIGERAFYNTNLTEVTLLDNVDEIGEMAFGYYWYYEEGEDEDGNWYSEEYDAVVDGFTIHGYTYTAAEDYANNNEPIIFDALERPTSGQCGDNVYWSYEDGVLTIYTEGEAEDEEQNGRMWDYDDWDDSPFAGRGDITSIVVEDGVTYIGNGAFNYCSGLESLYLGADVEDISFGGGAFVWCTSLSTIEVSESNETFYVEDGVLFCDDGYTLCLYPSCKEGDSYTIPDSVSYIEQWAFYSATSLTSVTIPDSVRAIGYEAFYNCYNLWEVTIPDTVGSIGYHAFGFADQEDEDGEWFEEMDGFTVYGYEGTEAQNYADQYDSVIFVALEIEPVNVGGYFGTNLYWSLDEEGTLTISVVDGETSGTMDFEDVGDAPWYEYRLNVNNIVIEEGVESIASGAFAFCSNAETVDIQADITSVDYGAFCNCTSLTSVTLPDSVTYIDSCAFMNCYSLTAIDIPDSVTSIGTYAFLSCYSLESVTLPDNEEFTTISYATFFGCASLTKITIPDTVTVIEDSAFYECSSLESVTIPDSVTSIGNGAFYDTALTEVTIPDSVEEIGEMAFGYYWFYEEGENEEDGWYSVEYDAVVDGFTIYGYTGTAAEDYANNNEPIIFVALDGEEETVVDSGQCGDNVYWKLYEDGALTIYTEGEAEDESQNGRIWDYGESPFTGRDDITSVVIEDGVTYVGSYTFWNCESLTSATLPDGVDAIGEGAFSGCTSLESVNIPDGVTSIGNYAFMDCNMTELVIPDSVSYIGNSAFQGCSSLQSVTLPNNEDFTAISDGTFYECTSLESIDIPDSVTTIGESAFCYSGLTEIVIPDSVTYIGQWVFTNTNLTEIVIPDSVTYIGNRTFYNCTSLTSVTLPDNEEFTEICEGTFNSCSSLESIDIPDSVTTIGAYSFQLCTSLTSVTLPDSGEATEIGEGAFYGCYSLGEVTIPDSVTSIGSWAFFNNAFTEITVPVSVEEIGDKALGYCWTEDSDDNTALIEGFLIRGHAGTAAETYASDNEINFEGIHYEGEAVTENEIAATCTEDGSYDTVVYCTVCGEEVSRETTTVPATGHSYGEAVFTWAEDYTATAAFTCGTCGDVQTVDAEVTSEVTTEATCTTDGVKTYTATVTFEGEEYTDTATETIEATGHDYEAVVTEPTCTEGGYTTYTCANCGDSYIGDLTDALGHSYGEPVFTWAEDFTATAAFTCGNCGDVQTVDAEVTTEVTTEATCTTNGAKTYTATVTFQDETYTDTAIETIEATGHSYGEPTFDWADDYSTATATFICGVCEDVQTVDAEVTSEVTTEATCTAPGVKTYTATVTFEGEEYTSTATETIEATGHDYEGVVTEPTCTEGGYTTYTCANCGDSYIGDLTDALGHSYGEPVFTWAEDFTATAAFTCGVCEDVQTVDAEVTSEVTTEATCTTNGAKTYTATVTFQDETYTDTAIETIEATGHTEGEAVKENEVSATCTTDGSYDNVVYCTVCGEEISRETVIVPATGHSYGEPTFDWADDYSTATAAFTCGTCGTVETVDATVESEVTTEATCTEPGVKTYTATVAFNGETYTATATETIEATGHDYKAVVTEPTCTEGGYTTYTCANCGESYKSDLTEATGHSYDEGVVTEPTCTEGGYTTYTCANCGESYQTDLTEATGHSYDEGVVTEPTCTEGGYTTYTCINCDDSYQTDLTEATGHSYGDATFTWASDYTATASFTCGTCGTVETVDATVESEVTKEATSTTTGVRTYTATVTFNGQEYTATTTETIPVAVTSLSDCTVTISPTSYTCDGVAKTPTVTVTNGDYTLVENTDYTVAYSNNVGYGTATVTITGTGSYTGTVSKTFTIAVLSTPSLSVSNTTSGVKISWGAVSGAAQYCVFVKSGSSWKKLGTTASTSFTDTTVKSGTSYTYTVRCVSADGNTWTSRYDSTGKTITFLSAPILSSATNTSSGVKVTWKAVTGAAKYRVFRWSSNGWVHLGVTTSTSFTDTTAKNGTKYTYTVRCINSAGTAYTSAYYNTGITTVRLTGVTLSSVKNVKTKKMTVKWKKNTKATGYQIQYSTSSDFSSYKTVKVKGYKNVSKTISKLTKGKKYYVRVRAYKTVSGTNYYSAWSSVKNVKISK